MESFSAEWLALREPADHAARAHEITVELAARLARHATTRAVDIGCGTGSNLRYLLPRLPQITQWTLVDHDPALLDAARRMLEPIVQRTGVALDTCRIDLVDLEALPIDACSLVTASALLDLVSAGWLRRLAVRCRQARAHVLAVLNYDGRIACDPHDRDDEWIRGLVNTHQRTDKGFGPALGPAAVAEAKAAFGAGEIRVSTSDWRLRQDAAALQRPLVDGWASAAREIAPREEARIERWRARRVEHIIAGRSSITVGHLDVAVFQDLMSAPSRPGV